ncbi:MAG: rhodanese-like domain-containing protein [Bacteroidota bacterium]
MRYLSLLFLSFFFIACQQSKDEKSTSEQETVVVLEPNKFNDLMHIEENTQIVDVRSPEEYEVGHLKGAQNVNINGDNFEDGVADLNKERPVFVYCQGGVRSAKAAKELEKMGFKEVYDLEGGISAWKQAGLRVKMKP